MHCRFIVFVAASITMSLLTDVLAGPVKVTRDVDPCIRAQFNDVFETNGDTPKMNLDVCSPNYPDIYCHLDSRVEEQGGALKMNWSPRYNCKDCRQRDKAAANAQGMYAAVDCH